MNNPPQEKRFYNMNDKEISRNYPGFETITSFRFNRFAVKQLKFLPYL